VLRLAWPGRGLATAPAGFDDGDVAGTKGKAVSLFGGLQVFHPDEVTWLMLVRRQVVLPERPEQERLDRNLLHGEATGITVKGSIHVGSGVFGHREAVRGSPAIGVRREGGDGRALVCHEHRQVRRDGW